ncbi:MAG: EAL domain-containing protein [Candidatus Accumulibacter sp.]|nr:EAL domain-containing protein [Accumulibacter sp.]
MDVAKYIEPHFQPIVWSKGTGSYAYEALFRFKGSDTLPMHLFRRWEKSGYVAVVDCAMVRKVHEALQGTRGMYRVAVNVSARTLALAPNEYFKEVTALAKTARRVIVEVTETYPVENAEALAAFVARCKAHQIYVALDDCKPPHEFCESAFTGLVKPHFLKIDGELLARCFLAGSREPLRDVVRLARAIGAVVIAEWIDSPAKRDFAAGVGANMLQGDWIAKPAQFGNLTVRPGEAA